KTSFTLGIDNLDTIRQKAIEASSWPILKVKLGTTDDRAIVQTIREVTPDKPLRVDANEGWQTKEHALEMIEWLARDNNIELIEQPLPAHTAINDWKWLKQRSPLPIFADESYHGASDIGAVAECFHGVNVKLVKTGGVTGALDALRAAKAANLKTMIGCM